MDTHTKDLTSTPKSIDTDTIETHQTFPLTPPPPPPPPLPPQLQTRPHPSLPPLLPLPRDAFKNHRPSVLERKFLAATAADYKPSQPESPFKPCYFFFYGSLMDPEVLQTILGLPSPPVVQKGTIFGFVVKMWGIYPTLVPSDGGRVYGTFWRVQGLSQFLRLKEYETSAYTWSHCDIETSNGDCLRECRTFCWAGDPESGELQEGSFDLERYQRYFKPSVVRKLARKE